MRTHFKILPEGCTLELAGQWIRYCEIWPGLPDELKKLDIGSFWRDPRVLCLFVSHGGCAELQRVANFWASFPTSNVNVERAFSVMRAMEGPQRYSLSPESVREELMIKVNHNVTTKMVTAAAAISYSKYNQLGVWARLGGRLGGCFAISISPYSSIIYSLEDFWAGAAKYSYIFIYKHFIDNRADR